MADTIKGLTVKIGADTKDFVKELKKVDKEINSTQRTANELQKGLELQFDSKRFIQAQKKAQSALEITEQKAEAIKKQLKFLEDTGGIDTAGYKQLETELAKTETRALKLNEQLEKIESLKLNNATKGVTELSNNLEKAAQKTAILSAGAAGLIAGIYKLGTSASATGAGIQDMVDRLGISAEAFQRYNYIALQSGVETEQLAKSLSKTRAAIGAAMAGETNTAVKALQQLFGDLKRIPSGTEEAFTAIVDEISKVEDSTMQAYYANALFGEKLATNLIPLINNGADRLQQLGEEFESIGYLSGEQVEALADFDDQINILNERLSLAKTELGVALIPVVEQFVAILVNFVIPIVKKFANAFNDLPEPIKKITSGLLMLTATLSPILFLISKIIGVIPLMINMFVNLKSAIKSTSLGLMALGGALITAFDLMGNWSQLSTLEKVLKSLGVAFLTAAAAITVFHASWSLGIAVGAIAAAVTAGIAAINAAGDSLGLNTNFTDTSSISSINNQDFSVPNNQGAGGNSYSEDNSQYNIEINMSPSGNLDYDAEDLANSVIQKIIMAKQSSGRL